MVNLMRLWGFIRGASVIIISTITALWLLQGIPVAYVIAVIAFQSLRLIW